MEYSNLTECIIEKNDTVRKKLVHAFLIEQGLRLEENIDYTYVLFDNNSVVATGSLDEKVIKCVAVDKRYQGYGITNRIVSHLLNEAYRRGVHHVFVYTKPENLYKFNDLGFYKIAEVSGEIVLLENKKGGINSYLEKISTFVEEQVNISAIVVNCNPFTLGHQYLIEKAAEESDLLYVFVVSEDKSEFPTEIRFKLVKEGTKHIPNVIVHQTDNYLISSATFPTYFLKKLNESAKIHTLLDIQIFAEYFVPALRINKRYVGEEPLCPLTCNYNVTMKTFLPKYGVEVIEVPRREMGQKVISASRVRQLIKEGNIAEIKELVPATTYNYLLSSEGKKITNGILANELVRQRLNIKESYVTTTSKDLKHINSRGVKSKLRVIK